MKKKIILFLSILTFIFSMSFLGENLISNAEEYVPTFSVFKSDTMEGLSVPTETPLQTADYIWGNTNLLWAETNNVKETKEALSGSKALNWMPGAGDSEGWTASNVAIGISPSKTAGSSGGYLLKLEFLLKLTDVDLLVVKAFDSNNLLRQEMIVTSEYTNGSDDNTIDKGEETVINIEPRSTTVDGNNIEHALVSFTIRSSATLVTYYTFTVKSKSADATVTLDDLFLYKEDDPVLPHRYYESYIEEGFECETVSDSLFAGDNTNVKEIVLTNEKPIIGKSSLSIIPSVRNKDVLVNSNNISLKESFYKLYFKFKGSYITKAGINVRNSETNEIIYDFVISPVSNERISSVANPLFDQSSYSFDSGNIYTCYGEFESKIEQDVYLELYYVASNIKGNISFDDVNLMKQYLPTYHDSYE